MFGVCGAEGEVSEGRAVLREAWEGKGLISRRRLLSGIIAVRV